MAAKIEITSAMHRQLGVDLFNRVWDLMEKKDRTVEDTFEMIHAAHASRYHWSFAGTAVNWARGEWQTSRVYSVLNHPEAALFHAQRCLDLCIEYHIGDFDLAYAYEALARGYALAGNSANKEKYIALAQEASVDIQENGDRKLLMADLENIP